MANRPKAKAKDQKGAYRVSAEQPFGTRRQIFTVCGVFDPG